MLETISKALPRVYPMRPARRPEPSDHDDRIFELKYDGSAQSHLSVTNAGCAQLPLQITGRHKGFVQHLSFSMPFISSMQAPCRFCRNVLRIARGDAPRFVPRSVNV